MGKRGPQKMYPHQLWVLFTDTQWDALKRESLLTGASMSDVVRDAVDQRLGLTDGDRAAVAS